VKRVTRAVVAIAVLLLITGTASAAPTKIVDDASVNEWLGSQIDGWTAWSANTVAHPKTLRVYTQADGAQAHVVPIPGKTFVGDIVQNGARAGQVVFEAPGQHNGDVRFYDPVADAMRKTPSGVNTAREETDPRADGDYLAFMRTGSTSTNLVLYRFSTAHSKVIAGGISPAQLNGDYLAAYRCTAKTCTSWRYRISTGTQTAMPAAPTGRANYWPAVTADGTMYWVQGSRSACGKNTKIMRLRNGSVATVMTVADGTELAGLEARTVGGIDQLVYTKLACTLSGNIKNTGIYKITV
jgi:hypothetical protein